MVGLCEVFSRGILVYLWILIGFFFIIVNFAHLTHMLAATITAKFICVSDFVCYSAFFSLEFLGNSQNVVYQFRFIIRLDSITINRKKNVSRNMQMRLLIAKNFPIISVSQWFYSTRVWLSFNHHMFYITHFKLFFIVCFYRLLIFFRSLIRMWRDDMGWLTGSKIVSYAKFYHLNTDVTIIDFKRNSVLRGIPYSLGWYFRMMMATTVMTNKFDWFSIECNF